VRGDDLRKGDSEEVWVGMMTMRMVVVVVIRMTTMMMMMMMMICQ
jgi:hypothetical protein